MELEADLAYVQHSIRSKVLSDFHDGQRHMAFVLVVKQAFWQELPYCFFSLVHDDEDVARRGACHCLSQWDKTMTYMALMAEVGKSAQAHPLASLFLDPSGPLRQSVLSFAQGASRDSPDMLGFRSEVARLQFAPVVSRAIEGRHSILKRSLCRSPNSSSSTCSLTMRLPEAEDLLMDSPEALAKLAAFVNQVRSPNAIIQHLGLQHHEVVEAGETQLSCKLCWKIVYWQDLTTGYNNLPKVFSRDDYPRVPEASVDSPIVDETM